jgi:cob(I)alamin adenosyltransferase
MFNHRVSKCHPRVMAYGCVDELNAALGLARSTARHDFVRGSLAAIQKDLVILMGELATMAEDLPRYVQDGYPLVTPELTAKLEELAAEIEQQNAFPTGWAMPGTDMHCATLDLARAICRRAERRVCTLHEAGQLENPQIIAYLNRLSDLLWLFALWVESKTAQPPA